MMKMMKMIIKYENDEEDYKMIWWWKMKMIIKWYDENDEDDYKMIWWWKWWRGL